MTKKFIHIIVGGLNCCCWSKTQEIFQATETNLAGPVPQPTTLKQRASARPQGYWNFVGENFPI